MTSSARDALAWAAEAGYRGALCAAALRDLARTLAIPVPTDAVPDDIYRTMVLLDENDAVRAARAAAHAAHIAEAMLDSPRPRRAVWRCSTSQRRSTTPRA